MRWSVSVRAEAAHPLTREQVVELADAVAAHDGIASGIGTAQFGAQLVVEADAREAAVAAGADLFGAAVRRAGLPTARIVSADALGEDEEE